MKIAVTSKGRYQDSFSDPRFGRCKYFWIAEVEGQRLISQHAVKNEGAGQDHGAGIKAAQQLGDLEVTAVVTGAVGPNALNALTSLGIKIYQGEGVIDDLVYSCIQSKLPEISTAVKAHSGLKQ